MKLEEVVKFRKEAVSLLEKAHIAVTPQEMDRIEVSDFGLGDIENLGLIVLVYENNDRYCAKEIILLPRQLCPEHRHPPISETNIGKQETFRCRFGGVYLYVPGESVAQPKARVPEKYRKFYTVWNEIVLRPGEQYTLPPNTLHWFQGGDRGAVLSEFSSTSTDENDILTDPQLRRLPEID
ncbi:MAG: D-lyxose/D-mannose family sugar isomerase [Acidobacteriota bacterium]